MTLWNEYYTPSSIQDALAILNRYGGNAQIIAGGTDLILDMQYNNHPAVEALVDVTTIEGLNQIYINTATETTAESDWIILGSAVTHTQIEQSSLLQQKATALVESCSVVGGPQVRNVATLGGNVAHALPAADGTIGLLALDAEVEVSTWESSNSNGEASAKGMLTREWYPLLSVFAGPGRNTLSHNQMLSAFRCHPCGEREASAFDRIMRPQGVALPIIGLAARVKLDEQRERVIQATIAIGPAGPIPFRATEAEQVLTSAQRFNEEVLSATIAAAQNQVKLRTSKHRASSEYRHEMIEVLLRRVLPRAVKRAQNAGA